MPTLPMVSIEREKDVELFVENPKPAPIFDLKPVKVRDVD